ncbi:hypothetical protein EMEDMD4_370102 [Sinorhizobium medicae]|uniref:Uncharacterized protein n=1 Tax=Sinorhizobium medicae TaxID=110321 RepID=A0A508WXS0_9HYPH|nr:hypothetical protein EMEDMD4_370102 [Sinorhizobium medicae]
MPGGGFGEHALHIYAQVSPFSWIHFVPGAPDGGEPLANIIVRTRGEERSSGFVRSKGGGSPNHRCFVPVTRHQV